jgi:hypothetical protein
MRNFRFLRIVLAPNSAFRFAVNSLKTVENDMVKSGQTCCKLRYGRCGADGAGRSRDANRFGARVDLADKSEDVVELIPQRVRPAACFYPDNPQ